MSSVEQTEGRGSAGVELLAEVTPLPEVLHPHGEDIFLSEGSLLSRAHRLGQNLVEGTIDKIDTLRHALMHGNFSEKFCREFDENRIEMTCEDGTRKTIRIFNPEFVENDRPALVYTFSLAVPGAHGIELATLADIVQLGEATGQAVAAITTEGQAGPTSWREKWQMTNFWNLVHHNFEALRHIFPKGKHMVITGSSLGGMMAHGMAATAEVETFDSSHELVVDAIVPVASAGHNNYSWGDKLRAGKQFAVGEGRSAINYVAQGDTPLQKGQRFFELLGTAPRHLSQIGSVACIAIGIMNAPLKGVFKRLPHHTKVIDITFSRDGVTQPEQRAALWEESDHPDHEYIPEVGDHLDLLTRGRELSVACLYEIAPPYIGPRLRPVA